VSDVPRQLVFDLPVSTASGHEDFLTSASNRAAVDLIASWPDWPNAWVVLAGPPSSGKSHLAGLWASRSGAAALAAAALDDRSISPFSPEGAPALLVEDIDRGIGSERVLFHLLNQARELKRTVLMTSRTAPGDIEIALPDLRSRLRAAPVIMIDPPDDGLLAAVLVKLFADRQLSVEPAVVSYLLRHVDRSMAAVAAAVARVDALSLARQRKVTRATVAEALAMDLVPDERDD
jgi:chromosomal replication initiation ATPase DnaA